MSVTVLLGGARSGKSRLAVELAGRAGVPVTFVATGEPRDDEMRERIAAHRAERPAGWATVEEPLDLRAALTAVPAENAVLLDCLSLWVANLLGRGDTAEAVLDAAAEAAERAAARGALVVAVSNEVGLGLVPGTPLGRAYRDLLGAVNRAWVERAESAYLVVAGRALRLETAAELR
jgi:adenosyl cobinamide kinase/adenosyl cobinamide phosphate guanylyltransferase